MEKIKELIKYLLLVLLIIVLISFILLVCTALFATTYYIVFWIVGLFASDNIAKIITGFIAAILLIIIFIWDEEKSRKERDSNFN